MTRICLRLALGASLTVLTLPAGAFAGRGGGMQRGGGGGMQRGGEGGGGYGGMSHSPSMSQPRPQASGSTTGARNPSQYNQGSGARNANSSNPNAGAAAAGAGYSNRNQPNHPNAAPAAAGAGYSNRNQPAHPNAAPAAAGAGYANRNQSPYSNAGAAAAGAGYANRNQSPYSNAGAAAAGAAYGNRNGYDQYHPGMAGGYWNGNYGASNLGAYGGMGMASPAYGYGSSAYMNPYAGAGLGGVGAAGVGAGQPIAQAQPGNAAPYDYSQPVNASAAPPDTPPATDPSTSPAAQARQAFASGDYPAATQLAQQALGQMPNDVSLHEFLALCLFAQGSYEQAAAPLYAVLSVGPGWDWTTLIGNYPDASTYTGQLRGLEAFVKANPRSAKALFVLAYHYISEGHPEVAIQPLKNVLAIQPNDQVSAQLLDKLQPPSAAAATAPPVDPSQLSGVWVAKAPPNATITLTMSDNASFTWAFAAPGQPPVKITGTYALADNVLTLSGQGTPGGPLAGQVAAPDERHLSFKAVGAPANDPGLQFAR